MAQAPETDEYILQEVRTTARRFLAEQVKIDDVATQADALVTSLDAKIWAAIVDMGWPAIALPEAVGGAGAEFDLLAVLFEETGRGLYPGPLFASLVLSAPALTANPEAAGRLISGDSTFTFAYAEASGSVSLADMSSVECAVEQAQGGLQLTGRKIEVIDAGVASAAVVSARSSEGVGLYLVDLRATEVVVSPNPGIDGTRRSYTVDLDRAQATVLVDAIGTPDVLAGLRRRALVAASFEAIGVAEQVLHDAVEYAKTREQFGKPIGAFQAVSGPLADCFVEIELARALADWAVRAISRDDVDVDIAVAAAKAESTDTAIRVVERAIQASGAIGFTWEYRFHRYLRRALWLAAFEGTSGEHRKSIAVALLDEGRSPRTVELLDSPESAVYRASVRTWVSENLPTDEHGLGLVSSMPAFEEHKLKWQEAMCQTGNLVAHWPTEYGGQSASDVITAIYREEAIRAHPRVSHGDCGVDLVAPLLMRYGTEEQKQRFLGPIRWETEIWTQGFSEPNSGSDLASLRTQATKSDHGWILNGNKTWSTYAPDADWIFVLARTGPNSVRHRGISCLLVDAKSPGVEIRPIKDIAGSLEFGEISFTDVKVPAANLLGDENEGWAVAVMTLAHERVIESYEDIGELGFAFDRLLDGLRPIAAAGGVDASVRDRTARLWSALQAVRLVQYRCVLALEGSDTPPSESEIVKLVWSEIAQQVASLGHELFALPASARANPNSAAAFWEWDYLNARSLTIYAGTSEIIRSVVAERVLGLPKSR